MRFFYLVLVLVVMCCKPLLPAEDLLTPEQKQELLQEPLPESQATEFEPDRFYAEFFKMMTMLGLIILLLLGFMWFVKKFLSNKITQMNKDSSIQILESRSITQKTSLYIVEVYDQKILVAESHTGSISLLELSSKEK